MTYASSIQNKTRYKCRIWNSPSGIYENIAIFLPSEVLHAGILLQLFSIVKIGVTSLRNVGLYTLHGAISQMMETWV
jgi:hypothetical protein